MTTDPRQAIVNLTVIDRNKKKIELALDLNSPPAVEKELTKLVGREVYVEKISRPMTTTEAREIWKEAVADNETELGFEAWLAEFRG